MDTTTELRLICGHDSRDVDGCVTCEAATMIESLRKQLADSQKQVMMLRDAVAYGVDNSDFDGETFDNKLRTALAATADLDGLIMCHRDSVAFLNPYGGVLQTLTTGLEKSTFTIPLYRAWEPK